MSHTYRYGLRTGGVWRGGNSGRCRAETHFDDAAAVDRAGSAGYRTPFLYDERHPVFLYRAYSYRQWNRHRALGSGGKDHRFADLPPVRWPDPEGYPGLFAR